MILVMQCYIKDYQHSNIAGILKHVIYALRLSVVDVQRSFLRIRRISADSAGSAVCHYADDETSRIQLVSLKRKISIPHYIHDQ